jgi:gas vesicle protein
MNGMGMIVITNDALLILMASTCIGVYIMATHDKPVATIDSEEIACERGIVLFDARFWVGILIGSAVGVSAGILLAPKSGKKTRRDITNSVKSVAAEAHDKLDDVKDDISDGVSAVKVKLSRTARGAKHELERVVQKGKSIKDKGHQLIEDIEEDIHQARI